MFCVYWDHCSNPCAAIDESQLTAHAHNRLCQIAIDMSYGWHRVATSERQLDPNHC